jgi:hypothetical protein
LALGDPTHGFVFSVFEVEKLGPSSQVGETKVRYEVPPPEEVQG